MCNDRCIAALLDDKDCAILALLQEQGDLPNLELARRVNLSPAATSRRVTRLRAEGVIEAVRAVVTPDAVGLPLQAFVLVTLADHSAEADARFARAVADLPGVLRADAITGDQDALVHVAAATPQDLHRLVLALKRAGAARALTMLRLQAIKPPSPVPVA
ncbi:Lrp/AsnC family transcriptional regulator [Solirubrobacter sp. CPCC 204708]|uniref:Lrp/AsnC family transcriptional regulator n=1 Tax=Solirubrobacter deserti TaxID=2282478 RepID=A0ABT4RPA0_9ACTN|nr:Lrp/AsnC family transcriptional regulator [Solirubrobacter deserti]MBE2317480.1 Lrp/AsnC family transcriptional regulator [Solirubrobacter deserti]MDA0140342.1 Lrp/AsnC family transcriptional regulator [Solirubrobacter deserti]